MERQWLLVTGNPINGFSFIGPFADQDEAIRFAEINCDVDWWLDRLWRNHEYETENKAA